MLLSTTALQERFPNGIPPTYDTTTALDDEYFLAHPAWFDQEVVERVQRHRSGVSGAETEVSLVDGFMLIDMPAFDDANRIIGRSLIIAPADHLQRAIAQGRQGIWIISFIIAGTVLLVVSLLMA
ncbi:hypothetical protein V6O07_16185, partial [Arthrospira platensis SPKY2]